MAGLLFSVQPLQYEDSYGHGSRWSNHHEVNQHTHHRLVLVCPACIRSVRSTAISPISHEYERDAESARRIPGPEESEKARAQGDNSKIAAEELARAKQEQSASGSFNDPYAVAEMRTRERLQALTAEWEKQDRELEVRMHEKMMQNSGMEDMFKMQQEMMKNYSNIAPPAK